MSSLFLNAKKKYHLIWVTITAKLVFAKLWQCKNTVSRKCEYSKQQTFQILTNDDQILILCLSQLITTVHSFSEQVEI